MCCWLFLVCLIVARCSAFVVCCLFVCGPCYVLFLGCALFVVCCLAIVDCCVLFVVCCRALFLFLDRWFLSAYRYLLLFVVVPFVVRWLLRVVC